MREFTEKEAKAKIGKRVRALFDGALFENDIKKGMEGKVSAAKVSHLLRAPDPNDVWAISVEFDNRPMVPINQIHKEQYEEALEEM